VVCEEVEPSQRYHLALLTDRDANPSDLLSTLEFPD